MKMETFVTYKLYRKQRQRLMDPPPYCRKYERDMEEKGPQMAHVKLEVSDPSNILALCESLTDVSARAIEKKINKYLISCTESETVFIISLHHMTEEAIVHVLGTTYLEPAVRIGISKDTIDTLKNMEKDQTDISEVPPDILKVIYTCLGDIVEDVRIVSIECKTHKMKFSNEATMLLVCLVKSKAEANKAMKYVRETFRFCLPLLLNTWNCQEEQRIKVQCQSLLAVARRLFSHLGDLDDLLREIMSEARRLTNSERCSLFLLDADHVHLVAKVFDGVKANENSVVKIAKDQGIAGHVAETGKLLNIRDAYQHPLFYKGMDEETGFTTRNILCFPIRDENGIIGVAQLCNKIGGHYDCYDEEAALAFSIYCGLSIMHSLVYKKIQDAQKRSQLSNELMIYHMKVHTSDIANVTLCPNQHDHPDFLKFSFSPRIINHKEMPCYMLKMFMDCNFLAKFEIKREMLVRFILYVEKGYRDTPYHNWQHAFSVAHFAYLSIKNFNLIERGYMSDIEALALIVSCMCHDIDHRGTTNSFQLQSDSILAGLYSSEGSVMERHHLSQTLCILNTKDCNFLESLDQHKYAKVLDMLRDNILATDLANHFKSLPAQRKIAETGYDPDKAEHRHLLQSLLMTCADLSDQTKDWRITKKVAELIYDEFFTQGDMEKQMGKTPVEMMDRDKAFIPDLQISFMNDVCLPVFSVLTDIFPEGKILLENLDTNIRCWVASREIFMQQVSQGITSMEILKGQFLEDEVMEAIQMNNKDIAENKKKMKEIEVEIDDGLEATGENEEIAEEAFAATD